MIIVLGPIGSDAGYWYIGADGQLHHQEGWGIESLREVSQALKIIQEATHLKTPGLADGIAHQLAPFVAKQFQEHFASRGVATA